MMLDDTRSIRSAAVIIALKGHSTWRLKWISRSGSKVAFPSSSQWKAGNPHRGGSVTPEKEASRNAPLR